MSVQCSHSNLSDRSHQAPSTEAPCRHALCVVRAALAVTGLTSNSVLSDYVAMHTTPAAFALGLLVAGCSAAPTPGDTAAAQQALLAAASHAPLAAAPHTSTAPPHALLEFQPGWVQVQRGALSPGTHVDVSHDASRLAACPAPTIFSYARFLPGGETLSSDEHLSFDVPAGATRVELWFHAIAPGCDEWDSDYGRNWPFPVVAAAPAAVGWAGDWGSSTSRACTHAPGVPQPIVIDEYMRERSCIFVDADVWVPGVTDAAATHPEWIQARVVWGKDAQATTSEWLAFQGIVGHNARYRWSIPYELRSMVDWTTAHYSFQFSTDGNDWTRSAQPSGDDWTIERAFVFSSN
jgi:hypothetical protein